MRVVAGLAVVVALLLAASAGVSPRGDGVAAAIGPPASEVAPVAQASATAAGDVVTALPPSEAEPMSGWAAALWWLLVPVALVLMIAAAWSQWRTSQGPVSISGPWWLHALRRRDERRERDEDF